MTIKETEGKLIRLDSLKNKRAKIDDEIKLLEDDIKQEMGNEEVKTFGAFTVSYKFTDTAGKINEDKLRADYPHIYRKYVIEKIDAKALSKGDPSAYNAVLVSGDPVRRFTYKINAEKLQSRTKKAANNG